MKIVITGAGGFVGKELAKTFSPRNRVLALTHRALDITDRRAVSRMMTDERPDLVINCAVLGVDMCQADPAAARAVNVAGARFLAESAAHIDGEILHLSTNYVFDGKRQSGSSYTNHDTASPINVYGETKLAGEIEVRRAAPKSYVVRTSWVFGRGKDNFFSHAIRALSRKERLRAVSDLYACVTYVADLAARIEEILAHRRYDTYHVVNSGACSHYDFALQAALELNLTPVEIDSLIDAVAESDTHRPAPRPRYTPMICLVSEELGFAPMRHWHAALSDYLRNLDG